MAHFYTSNKKPSFLDDIKTAPQARKRGKCYPSVTTVLGITKDEFIDTIYTPKELCRLAREHPHLDWQVIREMTYGFRTHPTTQEEIPSSEFGTKVHKRIEELLMYDPQDEDPFDEFAQPFLDWIEENDVEVLDCEYIISVSRFKIAGSVDSIGLDSEKKVF